MRASRWCLDSQDAVATTLVKRNSSDFVKRGPRWVNYQLVVVVASQFKSLGEGTKKKKTLDYQAR